MTITITNKKICDFHKKYPNINLDNLLCGMIDTIEQLVGSNVNIKEDNIINTIETFKTFLMEDKERNKSSLDSSLKLYKLENSELINDKFKKIDTICETLVENTYKTKYSAYHKGQESQNILEECLNSYFPDAEIHASNKTAHSGDFILKRADKDDIMIENKLYDSSLNKSKTASNVKTDEVKKFIDNATDLKMHGVLLSQASGISGKGDYMVEIINGKVLVYLHKVNYEKSKIVCAINIIDNLSKKLYELEEKINKEPDTSFHLEQEDMDKINTEVSNIVIQKDKILKTMKEYNSKLIKDVEDLKLIEITRIFADKCRDIQSWKCDVCGEIFPTKSARGSHFKKHYNSINDDNKEKPEKPEKKQRKKKSPKADLCIETTTD